MAAGLPEHPDLEIAHVLFTDLVGWSKLPIDEQTRQVDLLRRLVRSSSQVIRAEASQQLICLPTGDGGGIGVLW
jgi:hypothetical protein